MNVLSRTITQPSQKKTSRIFLPMGLFTDQMTSVSERHCQYKRISARLERSTYVLRSIDFGTSLVHQRLKPCRAMTLCWTANRPSRTTFTTTASVVRLEGPPLSIDFGTTKLPT